MRSRLALAVVGVLLLVFGLWSALARVPLFATSEVARLQARAAVHPVDALVAGRVTTVHIPVGATVREGDVLMTLDATDVQLRLAELRTTARGLGAQIAALEIEIAAREEALASTQSLGRASLSEAREARGETEAEASFAARESSRADLMREAGVVAESEADRANAALIKARAAASAHGHRVTLLDAEAHRDLADRRAQNESLRRGLAALEAERDAAGVQVQRLEVECDRHTVRAPIAGVLGQVRVPQVGSMVAVGQTIAMVTPDSDLELVAEFAPASAIGHILVGQRARMRVTGFPWTQYGMLEATVTAVSSEVLDRRIRVVLQLDGRSAPAIPRRHGLIGDVEVEINEVSPAILVARAAGQLFERSEPP